MKLKILHLVLLPGLWFYTFPSNGGSLTTDDLNVLGKANFYGDVNIGLHHDLNLTNGLVLYYDFDTDDGGSVMDVSGNNYTGTVTGASWTNAGFSGGAFYFDGTNDYITAGNIFNLTGGSSSITVSAIIKLDTTPQNWPFIIGKQQFASPNTGWTLAITPSGKLIGQIVEVYPARVEPTGATTLNNDQWHFVAATFQASASSLRVSVFVDGIKDTDGVVFGSYSTFSTSAPLTIGSRDGGASAFFRGVMDEVRIYDRVLSDAELTGLYIHYTDAAQAGRLNVKDLIVDNQLIQTGSGTNILMGPTGVGVTNPVGQLHVGGIINVDGNIRLNDNWLSGDGDNEGVAVDADGRVTILKLVPQGDLSMGTFTNTP